MGGIYEWFLNNSKVCRWFVYNVCGVWFPSALAVISHVGAIIKSAWKAIYRVMMSDDITIETVFKSIGPCLKNVGVCLLIGLGFSIWIILELLDRVIGLVPNPDKIHARYP